MSAISSDNDPLLLAPPARIRLGAAIARLLPAGRYRFMNWVCRRPPPPFWARMPAEVGGASFFCDLREGKCREVCFTGKYGPQETALTQQLLRAGMSYLDVGANWGYFTLVAAALVGPTGRVLSLEPDPRLFRLLEINVRRNGFDWANLYQVAAMDKSGMVQLNGYDDSTDKWGLSHIGKASTKEGVFSVAGRPLDDLLEEKMRGDIDLVKMDIEGAEGLAMRGLSRAVQERRIRRMILELHPRQLAALGQSVAEVITPLQEAGYAGWTINHSPEVTRRSAYARSLDVKAILRPFDRNSDLDTWPHILWVHPDLAPLE